MVLTFAQLVTWGAPALAWMGAIAAGVPILIHLLTRLRRRPQPWGAMRFLLEAYRKHRSRLRLEQILLLLVRCLILVLLGMALAGPALAGWSWLGGANRESGRLVCLVIDDALTTQAKGLDAQRRVDRLKAAALELLDALEPGDEVAVWRAARPAKGLHGDLPAPSQNHVEIRRAIEALEPRFSRTDLDGALESVLGAIDDAANRNRAPERTIVVVLSDWSNAALGENRAASTTLASLAGKCKLFTVRPEPAADNAQVVALAPHRLVVLAEVDGSATIPVEVRLRRFVAEPEERTAQITLTAVDAQGRALTEPITREHQWLAGQTTATLQAELALHRDVLDLQPGPSVPATLHVVSDGGDALSADDDRWSLVEVRRQMRIGVVDTGGAATGANESLTPAQWLTLALTPGGEFVEERIELVALEPLRVDGAALAGLDGALVLRPDALNTQGWHALRGLAESGGVVWLFTPADTGADNAAWAGALQEVFGLDWQLGLEPRDATEENDAQGWSLAADQPAPEALNLLAADWADLLRPVRVTRRLPLIAPGGAQQVWLSVSDGSGSNVLLAAAPLSSGRVMLLATALDSAWTNLPTKPLFVPLVHESLRSALSNSPAAASLSNAVAGERVELRGSWKGVVELRFLNPLPGGEGVAITLQHTPTGAASIEAVTNPGIYHADTDADRRIAVNLDPDAGDTRALDEETITHWFAPLAPVGGVQWLNPQNPAAILTQQVARTALAWPLLWAVLALVWIEAFLARWFSHARADNWVPWPQRVVRWIRG